MPIYTYECQNENCRHQFDIEQRISDGPLIQCSVCGQRLEKIIVSANFQLNGDGWFKDGYVKKEKCSE